MRLQGPCGASSGVTRLLGLQLRLGATAPLGATARLEGYGAPWGYGASWGLRRTSGYNASLRVRWVKATQPGSTGSQKTISRNRSTAGAAVS